MDEQKQLLSIIAGTKVLNDFLEVNIGKKSKQIALNAAKQALAMSKRKKIR